MRVYRELASQGLSLDYVQRCGSCLKPALQGQAGRGDYAGCGDQSAQNQIYPGTRCLSVDGSAKVESRVEGKVCNSYKRNKKSMKACNLGLLCSRAQHLLMGGLWAGWAALAKHKAFTRPQHSKTQNKTCFWACLKTRLWVAAAQQTEPSL